MRSILSQFNSIAISLVFAAIIWALATSEENPSREGFYPDPLPIEIVNRPANTVVYQKTAETVRLKVRAPQASWDRMQPTSFRIVADLQSLAAGMHQVPLKVQVTDPRVTVVGVEPAAAVGIRLEPLKARSFELHSDVLDAVPLGFTFKPPVANPDHVTVSGAAVMVDQVVEVAADVYLRGARTPIEREVVVVARDAQGSPVPGLTISPASVTVLVAVEQRVGYKDVSIKAVLKGTLASGYWISNIVVTPTIATIAASPDMMGKIPGFVETLPIDVNAATTDVTKRAALALPEGVSLLNNEGVTVQVSVTPILGGQTIRRKVMLQGLRRGLNAAVSPDSVEVILSGPLPALQNLTNEDVQVVVDVSGLLSGVYQLKPRVPVLPEALKVQNIVPDTIQVTTTEATPAPR